MKRQRMMGMLLAGGMAAALLTGCSGAPKELDGTAWEITELVTPDGTEYDEAAYNAIIGETIYQFEDGGRMTSMVAGQNTGTYTYAYEKGELKLFSENLECRGKVKSGRMELALGEKGRAILRQKTENRKN